MTTSLLLPATLTMAVASEALRTLSQNFQQAPEAAVVIDAAALQQFDTAALAVLLECQRMAQSQGRECVVRDAPGQLVALAHLYGVDAVLPFEAAPAAA